MHFKVRFDLLAELPIAAKKRSNLGDEATDQDLPWSSIGLPKPHGRMRDAWTGSTTIAVPILSVHLAPHVSMLLVSAQ